MVIWVPSPPAVILYLIFASVIFFGVYECAGE